MDDQYASFLARKTPRAQSSGFEPSPIPDHLFDFQKAVADFALRQGRAGVYLDTGLGKTRIELEWAWQCLHHMTGKAQSLILTPLAVAKQMEREGQALGYDCRIVRDQSDVRTGINICNYDRLDKLDADSFGAVALDESGILKSFNGATSTALINVFAGHRFRLSATATPAPNDHMELGQQSAFLGIMPANEMLMRWFINDTKEASQQWRLKGHATDDFWHWMASWSRMAQSPDDLGFDGSRYVLPPLNVIRHECHGNVKPQEGLFYSDVSAINMFEIKRQTSSARAKLAASIIHESLACGSQNTQIAAAQNIVTTKQSASAENLNADHLTTTRNTCETTTQTILENSKKHQKNKSDTTQQDVSDTPLILSIETEQSKASKTQTPEIQKEPSLEGLRIPLASLSMTTTPCLNNSAGNVQFAELQKPEDANTSTSTIATHQEKSEDCSAKIAIEELGCSRIQRNDLQPQSSTSRHLPQAPWVLWCDTDAEQKEIENAVGPANCISIYGSFSAEKKEAMLDAWLNGERAILVCKPSMFAYGGNWQHCCNTIFVGRTFSYETWYQAVRRFWRFGQKQRVNVHIAVAEGEDQIGRVIDRKANDHATMKAAMAKAMRRAVNRDAANKIVYNPTHNGEFPTWLTSAA